MKTKGSGFRFIAAVAAAAALCVGAPAAASASAPQVVPTAKPCVVTSVVTETAQAARAALEQGGCTNVSIRMCASDSVAFGHIIRQRPAPGTYPSSHPVTLWRVVRPATGIPPCRSGPGSTTKYDGIYTYTASQGAQTCTTTYTSGQAPQTTSFALSPFGVGTPAFLIKKGAFVSPIFEGAIGPNGRVEVSPVLGLSYFPDPDGSVTFAGTSRQMTATGTLTADNVTVLESSSGRTVCSVRYTFTAERTESPS